MKTILKTEFGSVVYGTNLPSSDKDYKGIIIPSVREIILQNCPKTIQNNTKEDPNAKNSADDVDEELFSLHYYLKLLSEGQTPCIDLLFTPKKHWIEVNPIWEILLQHKQKLLNKQVSAFVGYTRTQAAKYGIKGTRIAAIKNTLDWLSQFSIHLKLIEMTPSILLFIEQQKSEFINKVEIKAPNGLVTPHLEVCGRKISFFASVKYATDILQKIYDEYGHRARLAETNQGIDWKALYHAVRVEKEAQELLLTNNITFPRPEAALLLKIRKGELPYKEVADLIEEGLYNIEQAQLKSTLAEKSDITFINDFVFSVYSDYIQGGRWNII